MKDRDRNIRKKRYIKLEHCPIVPLDKKYTKLSLLLYSIIVFDSYFNDEHDQKSNTID